MAESQYERPPEGEGESADLFDYQLLKDYALFLLHGLRRNRLLALGVFGAVLALAILAAALLPRTYHVEAKFRATNDVLINSLGNPNRISFDDGSPNQEARELILRRDNVVALIKQTNLIDRWAETRAPILKAKDAVFRVLRGEMSDEDKIDAMVGFLERRIQVDVDRRIITIGIDWPDPQLAYQLVEAAQQNFFESQHVSEVSAIAEAISILEIHASNARETLNAQVQQLDQLQENKRRGVKGPAPTAIAAPARSTQSIQKEQELAQLRSMIAAKQRAITDLEDHRQRQLSDLKRQLEEQKLTYSEAHPVIVNTEQRIAALQRPSPQVISLRNDEASLLEEYQRKGGKDAAATIEARGTPSAPRLSMRGEFNEPEPALGEDPSLEEARREMARSHERYSELIDRIEKARYELDAARAAFKYRYMPLTPAQVPKKPSKPNVALIVLGGLLGALMLALLAGAARDFVSGRIVEPWQIERSLGLPVLAEVKRQ